MDDIVLSQTAAKLKKEYMKDILICQAGDSLAFDMALFDERYLAHDTFETNFDILQDVNFELGLFFEDNLQHWVNADNQPLSDKAEIEYDYRFVPQVSETKQKERMRLPT